MSRKKDSGSKVNPKLTKAINEMLEEVMAPGEEKKKVSLTDRCKVIDRALKLEGIRLKIDDAGYGTGFANGDDD